MKRVLRRNEYGGRLGTGPKVDFRSGTSTVVHEKLATRNDCFLTEVFMAPTVVATEVDN